MFLRPYALSDDPGVKHSLLTLDICLDLQQKFGFQRESMRNVVRTGAASTMRPLSTDIATNFHRFQIMAIVRLLDATAGQSCISNVTLSSTPHRPCRLHRR